MSRVRTRRRERRQRDEGLRAEVLQARRNPDELWKLLVRLAGSDVRVWGVVEGLDLDPDEETMVAQAVSRSLAPGLADWTPAWVRRLRKEGKKP